MITRFWQVYQCCRSDCREYCGWGPFKYYVSKEVGEWGQKIYTADIGRWVDIKNQKHADVILELPLVHFITT